MKKKIVSIILCIPLVFGIAACSGAQENSANETAETSSSAPALTATEEPTETPEPTPAGKKDKNGYDEATNIEEGFWIYDLSIPSYWTANEDNSISVKSYVADENGRGVAMLQLQCQSTNSSGREEIESDFENLLESLETSLDDYQFIDSSTVSLAGEDAYCADFYCTMNDVKMESKVVASKHDGSSNMYGFFILQAEDAQYDYFSDFEKMIADVTLNSYHSSDNESAETSTDPTPTAEPTSDVPLEYQNALSQAHDYLDFTSFSYTGLVEQLEYEGYSTEACTYAADHCGADWNQQALEKAQSYLDFSAFSYSGLIEQLEFEGFTAEQATYAADNCGADWNEQAAKKAQDYLDFTSFSRQGLIDQLIYEGFTAEQAEYGVSAVGY